MEALDWRWKFSPGTEFAIVIRSVRPRFSADSPVMTLTAMGTFC